MPVLAWQTPTAEGGWASSAEPVYCRKEGVLRLWDGVHTRSRGRAAAVAQLW